MRCDAVLQTKIFATLDKAQHECMRNDKCSAVYGRSGNAFEHTQFHLCPKRSGFNGIEEIYNPKLPDSLYMKPGTELSITNYVEIPKVYLTKRILNI